MTSAPEPRTAAPRLHLPRSVRAVVSVALLGWLASRIPFAEVGDVARSSRTGPLVVAVVAIIAGQVLRAVRTCALLRGGIRAADVVAMLRMQMLAFLPGMLSPAKAGELLKVELMRREWDITVTRGTAAFLAERAADVLLLGGCALWAAVVLFQQSLPAIVPALGAVTIAAAVVAAYAWRSGRIPPQVRERLQAALADVRWAPLLGSSVAYWLVVVGIVWLFTRSVGGAAPFTSLLGVVPVTLLTALLPISIGGFGVREGAMVALFQHAAVGCTQAQAISVSLLYDVLGLGVPALMGLAYMLSGGRHD